MLSEKQKDTGAAYRDLLSRRESDGPLLVVNKAPDLQASQSRPQPLTDREKLWEKIVESKLANDDTNADFLLRIYLSLPKEDVGKTLRVPVELTDLRSMSADAAIPTQKSTSSEKTVKFIKGSVPNHCDIGFTPFFDKNIRELKGPLPLTIFDKEWQEDAVNFHSGKKSKSDEKDGIYTGYEYPNEWSQSFSAWTNNFRSFLITYRDIYKIPEFAEWIVAHKANVDEIIANEGFLTGFRYDMNIRANAFAYRVETSDGASVVDISVMRKDVREKAWAITRKLDKLDFKDNPYAHGGVKFGYDPKTGRPKMVKGHKSFADANPYPSGNNTSGYGNSPRGRGGFRKKGFGRGGYGYENGPDRDGPNAEDYRGWGDRRFGNQDRFSGQEGYSQNKFFHNQAYSSGQGYNREEGYKSQNPGSFRNNQMKDPVMKGNGKRDQKEAKDVSENTLEKIGFSDVRVVPDRVSCEMNVIEWEKALSENMLLPEFQDVVEGFTNGFDQGIPAHTLGDMKWYTPDNHRSSELAREDIKKSISKEINAKPMFGPFSHRQMNKQFGFFRSNPLGAVVNGDGAIRPINDLSYPRNDDTIKSVNSFVNKQDFETTWDDFKTVSKFFAEDPRKFELALFDWEKAYRQIPTKRDQWRYLLVQDFDGNLLVDTRITFGGVAGCGSFGRPADAWKLIMRNHFQLANIFRWVDDNLFVRELGSDTLMSEVVKKSTELGVLTNAKKYSEFSNSQKFIGFVWDGITKTVKLPEGKIEQRLNQIYPFQQPKAVFDYEDAEVLVGRLNHVSYMLPHLRCNLCSLYKWLKSWIWRKAKRATPADVLLDLNVWVETLQNFKHTRLIRPSPEEKDLVARDGCH
ncbi:hypothetical protein PGT21_020755 [Puccinia graminis f. sp. tritici]|uniref:Reverse transcriptase domain-containing protein n=2 Tax=Puccinia graminis f. sp. tritici TaxID=56615 RepID=A0A5B0NYV9_PUCGR|nr:hypothetical protein PGT21_020755 [Puccinia graminis f. sp. tritici]